MIPPDDPIPETIVESFISSLSGKEDYYKRETFWRIVDKHFKSEFNRMDSWDEWHDYLASLGIIIAKRYLGEVEKQQWAKWARAKGLHMRKNPALSENWQVDQGRTTEYILIPNETLEKMIVLGILEKE